MRSHGTGISRIIPACDDRQQDRDRDTLSTYGHK